MTDTSASLRQLREQAGVTLERLARDMDVSVDKLRRWESGAAKVPRLREEQIRWFVALAADESQLKASGIPECEWVRGWEASASSDLELDALRQRFDELAAHAASCEVCRARDAYLRQHAPALPPMPVGGWRQRVSFRLADWIGGLWDGDDPRGTAWIVGLSGAVVALRFLPHWNGFLVLLYPTSLVLASIVAVRVYHRLAGLYDSFFGRWLARCGAGVLACWVFVATYLVPRYSDIFLSAGSGQLPWRDGLAVGAVMGLAYGTLWPIASRMRGA